MNWGAAFGTVLGGGGFVLLLQFFAGLVKDRKSGKASETQFIVTGSKNAVETMSKTLSAVQSRVDDLEKQLEAVTKKAEKWLAWADYLEKLLEQNNIVIPLPERTAHTGEGPS